MGWFKFDGRDSRDFGLRIEHIPGIPSPVKSVTEYTVPGRNGVLHADSGSFEDITLSYEVWFRDGQRLRIVPRLAHGVKAWLLAGSGYRWLQDSYDPEFIRRAVPSEVEDIENRFMLHGRTTLSFACDPRAFLLSGTIPQQMASGGKLHNPFPFTALPLIKVTGSGAGSLTVGDLQIDLTGLSDYICIDCERQNVYRTLGENKNEVLVSNGAAFPALPAGETAVSWSGGVTAVEITPRWWTV